MFVLYKIKDSITIDPSQTGTIQRTVRHKLFQKYLYKISSLGICVSVHSIIYESNIILRETADVKVQLELQIVFLQLKQNQYFEGVVSSMNERGIIIKFLGFLQGLITQDFLHKNSFYDEENLRWVFMADTDTAYTWDIGAKARFRIHHFLGQKVTKLQDSKYSEIIRLKSNEVGLGPEKWWI